MVTLADVARASGVSPMTVSNALRGRPNVSVATRQRVLEVADRLGYRMNALAKGLRSGRTGVIGLAIPELDMPFPSSFAAEVTSAAAKKGLRVIVQQTHSERSHEQAILRDGLGSLIDGVIMSALGMTEEEVERAADGRPVVLMDEGVGGSTLDVVCSPNREGSAAAGRHLAESGCRNVIALGVSARALESPDTHAGSVLRLQGLLEGLSATDIPFSKRGAVDCQWTPESAREAVTALVRRGEEFDGIFCMTDSVALGALRGLADCGIRCPQDVKVIGFDGIREGGFSVPSLTTIDIDRAFMARSAVEMLLDRIENRGAQIPSRKVVSHYSLCQRESTGK